MNLPTVNRWNYSRDVEREVKLFCEGNVWVAIAFERGEEHARARGGSPGEAMRAIDAELGRPKNRTGGG
jgi:hypothetical protein